MIPIRSLPARRRLATLIVAAALFLKLLIPTGWMIGDVGGRIGVTLCAGAMNAAAPAMTGMPHHRGDRGDHGKVESPCAFSGLSWAATAATDPIQLAALILFVAALGLAATPPPPRPAPPRLRPPPTGPPIRL